MNYIQLLDLDAIFQALKSEKLDLTNTKDIESVLNNSEKVLVLCRKSDVNIAEIPVTNAGKKGSVIAFSENYLLGLGKDVTIHSVGKYYSLAVVSNKKENPVIESNDTLESAINESELLPIDLESSEVLLGELTLETVIETPVIEDIPESKPKKKLKIKPDFEIKDDSNI